MFEFTYLRLESTAFALAHDHELAVKFLEHCSCCLFAPIGCKPLVADPAWQTVSDRSDLELVLNYIKFY